MRADVEWTIWEGSVTSSNISLGKSNICDLEVGDIIYVYGTGTLSQAIYKISGDNWGTWTALQSYVPAVSDGDNYYHVITNDFLTAFDYSSVDTKAIAIGNWNAGTITKITIKKKSSAIKTTLSSENKSLGNWTDNYNLEAISTIASGDYLYIPATRQTKKDDESDVTWWNIQFQNKTTEPWTNFTNYAGDNGGAIYHDIWYKVGSTEAAVMKTDGVYINGQYYNTEGIYLYHPINSFKIGSIGMATFSADQEVTVPEGLTAYKATISGDNVTLTTFTDNVIPAGKGAIIVGDEGSVVEFEASSTGSSEESDLKPVITETDVTTLPSGYDYYVLYAGTGEKKENLELSTLLGAWGSWHSEDVDWDNTNYTITYKGKASGEGGWVTKNWSNYDYLRLNFSSNTLNDNATFYVAYYEHDSNTTQATLSKGATTIDIPLDAEYKNLNGDFSMWSNATSGSLTFASAALIDNDGATVAEFRKTESGTIAANKAYLRIPNGGGAKLNIVFAEDENKQGEEQQGETNSIRNIANTNVNSNVVYNMNGQRVGSDYKGIVIINGKKYLHK